jgi:tungstate transport system permease protein
MNDFSSAFHIAFKLIVSLDDELWAIVSLSLEVNLTASACAFLIGAPLGTALAGYRFFSRPPDCIKCESEPNLHAE